MHTFRNLKTIVALAIVLLSVIMLTGCDAQDYKAANELFANGEYIEALAIYEELEDYEDSQEQVLACRYEIANTLYADGEFETATNAYIELGNYRDSQEKAKICMYELACSFLSEGNYHDALQYFTTLEDYEDAKAKASECEREIGMRENADYDFLEAIEQSILNRMNSASNEAEDFSTLVSTELAYVEKFQNMNFYDRNLKALAQQYIEGLLIQKEALKKTYISESQILWQEGTVYRYEALNSLYNNYGFLTDNAEFVGTYVSQYEDKKALLDAYYAIEDDLDSQLTDGMVWNYDNREIYYTVTNNTVYTYSTVFQMYFYDVNGAQYESGEAYIENIAPGSSYIVSIYLSDVSRLDHLIWFNYYTDVKY